MEKREHMALYRQYRPALFCDVVGQEHITDILKNQIRRNKLAHAYLFCGTRGTGKTTTARILARAINCLAPVDGEPCGKCSVCTASDDAVSVDIVEMDAASNNGVDDIRLLREKLSYSPVFCRYKVYIIDEVHMISGAAANAFLKTLEEPPAHVKFILATTDPQKLPATILSRCQRFDFKRIRQERIADTLRDVASKAGVQAEDDAISLIADAADGSMRDGMSILEQCIHTSGGVLTAQSVTDSIGTLTLEEYDRIITAMEAGDAGPAVMDIEAAYGNGKDMAAVARELLNRMCDVMISRASAKRPLGFFIRAIDILGDTVRTMRTSPRQRAILLSGIIRIARADRELSMDALASRVAAMEEKLASGTIASGTVPNAQAVLPAQAVAAPAENSAADDDIPPWEEAPAPVGKAVPFAEKTAAQQPAPRDGEAALYDKFIDELKKKDKLRAGLMQKGCFGGRSGDVVTVEFDRSQEIFVKNLSGSAGTASIGAAAQAIFGAGTRVEYRLVHREKPDEVKRVEEISGMKVKMI